MTRVLLVLPFFLVSCAITATRPVQDMSNTAAAIKAAKEVQADVLAPELYRQATEWFFKAKREYKFKYFRRAKMYSTKARRLAENAEFEALSSGATRLNLNEEDPLAEPEPGPENEPAEGAPDPADPLENDLETTEGEPAPQEIS